MRSFNNLARNISLRACLIFLSLLMSFSTLALDIRSLIFDISKIALENEISVTSISNEDSFIKIKGPTYSRGVIQEFTKRLYFANDMATYEMSDVVPFLEKEEFVIVLRPREDTFVRKDQYVIFTSPSQREKISKDEMIKGRCSREGAEVILGGDVEGKAMCIKGGWEFKVSVLPSRDSDFISVTASQRMMNQEIVKDYRSFLLP